MRSQEQAESDAKYSLARAIDALQDADVPDEQIDKVESVWESL